MTGIFDPWGAVEWLKQSRAAKPARHKTTVRAAGATKPINLALQGGGAHGAFTWGVLDQLLLDGRLTVEGISGASAGAVNAVMFVDGMARGGPDMARQRLADFWRAASIGGGLTGAQRAWFDGMKAMIPMDHGPLQAWTDTWSRFLSPYDMNPLKIDPLRDVIAGLVDFETIRAFEAIDLFVSATNVRTGKPRVFARHELTADMVMASAALPHVFRAVEIDGVPYWDGGFTSNPPVYPLLRPTRSADVLVVQINPLVREDTPHTPRDIFNRVDEITFNSSLAAELRVIEFMGGLIEQGQLRGRPGEYRRINMHRIVMGGAKPLPASTKLNTDFQFFETLFHSGQRAARRFLDRHFDDIGVRSTIEEESDDTSAVDAA
jgi:NTE family protein